MRYALIRNTLLIALPIAMLVILVAKTIDYAEKVADKVETPTIAVTEDDPHFDCRTMGNRICGPVPVESHADAAYDIAFAEEHMRRSCYGAIVWAEYNATQPGAYEVLAHCPPV